MSQEPTITVVRGNDSLVIPVKEMANHTYGIVVDSGGSDVVHKGRLVFKHDEVVFEVENHGIPSQIPGIRVRPVSVVIQIEELT